MMHKVKKHWTLLAFMFLQARETQNGAPRTEDEMRVTLDAHVKAKILALGNQLPSKQSMKELAERLIARKNCDVARLEDTCANFHHSMLQYKHDFSEQKTTLVDEATLNRQATSAKASG